MSKVNAAWHNAHEMPKRASLDKRITWHLAHAKACSCRALPASIREELRRRGLKAKRTRRSIKVKYRRQVAGGPKGAT